MGLPILREKRTDFRFTTLLAVSVAQDGFAEITALARNVSAGGMLIETSSPAPLGSEVVIRFELPGHATSIRVRAEVKGHYALNYAAAGAVRWARGMGVRFLEFLEDGRDHLQTSLARLH